MSTPQLENGYTRLANELLDALIAKRIPGEPMQCFLFILRRTYGFGKKEDAIPLSQFEEATGIPRPNVARAISRLVADGLVIKNDNSNTSSYRINKDFNNWGVSKTRRIKSDNRNSIKMDNKTVIKKDTLKRKKEIKEKPPCNPPAIPYQEIVQAYNDERHPSWPQLMGVGKGVKDAIKPRWDEDKERQNVKWWRWYFRFAREHPHLRGETPARDGGRPWTASFLWLVGPKNMTKVLAGYYQKDAAPKKSAKEQLRERRNENPVGQEHGGGNVCRNVTPTIEGSPAKRH